MVWLIVDVDVASLLLLSLLFLFGSALSVLEVWRLLVRVRYGNPTSFPVRRSKGFPVGTVGLCTIVESGTLGVPDVPTS
jgi:hypothetical protein